MLDAVQVSDLEEVTDQDTDSMLQSVRKVCVLYFININSIAKSI